MLHWLKVVAVGDAVTVTVVVGGGGAPHGLAAARSGRAMKSMAERRENMFR